MILITGASGLLGANLALTAHSRGYDVSAASHSYGLTCPEIQSFPIDLTDYDSVIELFYHTRPEWVVHCAALTDVDRCETHPQEAWMTNVEMTRNIATAAQDFAARVVYISTDGVFTGEQGNYHEAEAPAPINHYARTKLAGELAVTLASPDSLILRTNLFGWNCQDKFSLAEWVLDRLQNEQAVPGFSDVTFSPLLANDLSDIILDLIERNARGIFHVGARDSVTKYEFARLVAKEFGYSVKQVHKTQLADADLIAPRPYDTSLATEKLHATLERALPSVAEGIARMKQLQRNGYRLFLKQSGGVSEYA